MVMASGQSIMAATVFSVGAWVALGVAAFSLVFIFAFLVAWFSGRKRANRERERRRRCAGMLGREYSNDVDGVLERYYGEPASTIEGLNAREEADDKSRKDAFFASRRCVLASSQPFAEKRKKKRSPPAVCLLTYGTRGDVEPMVALAIELQKRGVQATVCASACYKNIVKEANGVLFASCGVDEVIQTAEMHAQESFSSIIPYFAKIFPRLCAGMWKCCVEANADFIVAGPLVTSPGLMIARKLGIPCWAAHFAPSKFKTKHMPPPEDTKSYVQWPWINKAKYDLRNASIIFQVIKSGMIGMIKSFHASIDLPQLSPSESQALDDNMPVLLAYSSVIQPRAPDWPHHLFTCGYWKMPPNSDFEPSSTLMDFLRLEKRCVFVTLGSMKYPKLKQLVSMCAQAAFQEDCKVIIGCQADTFEPRELCAPSKSHLHLTPFIPHSWIFPKCACVIHHGGAGTTSSAAFAGVPSIVVPILPWADQTFWGNRVEKLRIGALVSKSDILDGDGIMLVRSTLRACFHKSIQARAARIKRRLEAEESGASVAASAIAEKLAAA